jgi:hypothetical protein
MDLGVLPGIIVLVVMCAVGGYMTYRMATKK